jgi:hypothetical protein
LTYYHHVDLRDVVCAVEKKLAFRKKKLAEVADALDAKEGRYKVLWEKRLSAQMSDLPEFEDVFRFVRRVLREAGITGK